VLSVVLVLVFLLVFSALVVCNRHAAALMVVAVAAIANIISLFLFYAAPTISRVNITVAAREVLIYFGLIVTFIFARKLNVPVFHTIDKIYLGLAMIIGIAIFTYNTSLISAVYAGRELILPLCIYFLFRFLRPNTKTVSVILKLLMSLAIIIAILSIAENIFINVFNQRFWYQVDIRQYLAQKYGSFDDPYPGSWINYLPVFIGLEPTFRSIGLMLDPLATGHFLACSFVVLLHGIRGSARWVILPIVLAGALATFSKATFLICLVGFGARALLVSDRHIRLVMLLTGVAGIGLLGALLLSTGDDAFTHYGSFRFGVEALFQHPLGNGIGSTGYFNYLVTGGGTVAAGDSTFAVYVYQLGIVGLLALGLLLGVPLWSLLRDFRYLRRRRQRIGLPLICISLFVPYTILAFASAAAFTAVPIFIPMMFLSLHVSLLEEYYRRHPVTSTSMLTQGALNT
jgi:hypothetical protein